MKNEEIQKLLDEINQTPYPELGYIEQNPRYANLLYDDLSGELGELSAITQYVYEHMDLKNSKVDDLSSVLLKIAIQEMRHLDLVGEIIKKNGKKPYFISSSGENWDSKFVKYNFDDLESMLSYNIMTEEAAIKGYQKAIMHTRNWSVQRLLNRIIADEHKHIKIFKMMKQS